MSVMATDRHRDPSRLIQAGQWLRETREERGMSQTTLAGLIGTSSANLSNYERGHTTVPDDRAEKIAEVLGVDVIEVRRNLGLWVPAGTEPTSSAPRPIDTLSAIQQDRDLLPEARRHLLNQYKLLRRLAPISESEVDASLDAIAKATQEQVEKKSKPRRKASE